MNQRTTESPPYKSPPNGFQIPRADTGPGPLWPLQFSYYVSLRTIFIVSAAITSPLPSAPSPCCSSSTCFALLWRVLFLVSRKGDLKASFLFLSFPCKHACYLPRPAPDDSYQLIYYRRLRTLISTTIIFCLPLPFYSSFLSRSSEQFFQPFGSWRGVNLFASWVPFFLRGINVLKNLHVYGLGKQSEI